MITVGPRAQAEHSSDRAEVEFAVEMGEQFIVARPLPSQCVAQTIGIDRDQEQSGLAEEVFPCGLRHLRRRGKMDVAVADIDRAAAEHTLPLGLAPGRSGADFIDHAHSSGVLLVVRVAWDVPGVFVFWRIMRSDRIDGMVALQGRYSRSSNVLLRAVKTGLFRE